MCFFLFTGANGLIQIRFSPALSIILLSICLLFINDLQSASYIRGEGYTISLKTLRKRQKEKRQTNSKRKTERARLSSCVIIKRLNFAVAISESWSMPGAPNTPTPRSLVLRILWLGELAGLISVVLCSLLYFDFDASTSRRTGS